MRTALILIALAACSEEEPSPYDAAFGDPVDTVDADCVIGSYGGDPQTACTASWQCAMEGSRSLLCGTGIDASGPACLCITEQGQTQVGVPASCMDLAVLVEFARTACGWSLQ